jgi:hypothetical protein
MSILPGALALTRGQNYAILERRKKHQEDPRMHILEKMRKLPPALQEALQNAVVAIVAYVLFHFVFGWKHLWAIIFSLVLFAAFSVAYTTRGKRGPASYS